MVLLNQNVTTNYSYQRNNVSSNFGLVEERLRRSHSKKQVSFQHSMFKPIINRFHDFEYF